MKKVILILVLLSSAMFVYADEGDELCAYLTEDLGVTTGMEIPSYVPYSNEVFNIYTKDGQTVGSVVIEESVVTGISCEETEGATYNIYISGKSTIDDVINSSSKADVIDQKLDDDEIVIEGQTFTKRVKNFFTVLGIEMGSWFS